MSGLLPTQFSSGVIADRPAADDSSLLAGALYAATDNGNIYQTDLSSWSIWVGFGGDPVTGLEAATLTDIGTPQNVDEVLVRDVSDSDNLVVVQASEFGGASLADFGLGWADYTDGTYTQGSPLAVAANTDTQLTNDAATTRETYKPSDITTFYDPATQTITGIEGEGRLIGVELNVVPSSGTSTYIECWLDIGGAVGTIYRQARPLPKGSGVAQKVFFTFPAFTLDTWEANGAEVYIRCPQAVDVYTARFIVHRLSIATGGAHMGLTIEEIAGATHTPTLAQANKRLRYTNAGAVTVTIPTNAAVAYSIGTVLRLRSAGAGGLTVSGDTGVTVNGAGAITQDESAVLEYVGSDEWDMHVDSPVDETGGGGGGGAGNLTGSYDIEGDGSPTYTDAGMSDEFDAGTLDAQWTITNAASGTVDLVGNPATPVYDLSTRSGCLLIQADGGTGDGYVILTVADTLADGEQIIASCLSPEVPGTDNNQNRIGIGVADGPDPDQGASGDDYKMLYYDGSDAGHVKVFGTIGGSSTTDGTLLHASPAGRRCYFRIARDGSNYRFFYSVDGTVWAFVGSTSLAATHTFLVCGKNSSTSEFAVAPIYGFEWVRHVANHDYDPW